MLVEFLGHRLSLDELTTIWKMQVCDVVCDTMQCGVLFLFFYYFLFKQYLFLTFVPKARGLQKIQRFFRTSVRHTVRKEKNKTKTITTSANNRQRKKNDYEVKRLVSIIL